MDQNFQIHFEQYLNLIGVHELAHDSFSKTGVLELLTGKEGSLGAINLCGQGFSFRHFSLPFDFNRG